MWNFGLVDSDESPSNPLQPPLANQPAYRPNDDDFGPFPVPFTSGAAMFDQTVDGAHEQHHCPGLTDEERHDYQIPTVSVFVGILDMMLEFAAVALSLALSFVFAVEEQGGWFDD
ncbi:MAG: hypothetical protein LV481_01335 [Methylacidiphilales bacterium]|nr:hypothetical protein [Candidatus Methylacidiphilales bacterium]